MGIADPWRCRGRPCKKIENLLHCVFFFCFLQFLLNANIQGFAENKNSEVKTSLFFCGERGIRTPGTGNPVRQFSKLVVSATHPPLRAKI